MARNQVDLWSADLDVGDSFKKKVHMLLSSDERERAQNFRFPIHKSRFVVRRGVLRMLLGRYLDRNPETISFSYGANGKPFLPDKPLHFNLSHSGGRACFAFSTSSPIGIDIEQVRPFPELMLVAEQFCSSAEFSEISCLPEQDRLPLFFRCWTRREAIVKALGTALCHPADRICMPSAPVFQSSGMRTEYEEQSQLCIRTWEVEDGYIGALASCCPEVQIVQHRFTDLQ